MDINHSQEYKQHNQTDLYAILGVTTEATQEEIKMKYNEMVLLYHPDKGGDAQKFKDLKVAYKILSNPKNREIYTKSLSSTFIDITQEYRDAQTGHYKDVGYEINLEDFTRGSNEEQKEKRERFMKQFEKNRQDAEKKIIEEMEKSIKRTLTFEEMKLQRERDEKELEISAIEGIDPRKLNLNLFNQIFEANKNSQSRELAPLNNPHVLGQTGLAPLDNQFGHGSMFTSDPWLDYQKLQDVYTYKQPVNVDIDQYKSDVNITRTRENNPSDLAMTLEERLKEQQKQRENLFFLETDQYTIDPQHDPQKNPLSHLNMLGEDNSIKTITPKKI